MGVGVGSDGSTGVGVILGSLGVGVAVKVELPATRFSFEIVVANVPEIKKRSAAAEIIVFLNILPPSSPVLVIE